ncbi:MAG: RICIN domain-containing protein [Armatimonadota bacterium]
MNKIPQRRRNVLVPALGLCALTGIGSATFANNGRHDAKLLQGTFQENQFSYTMYNIRPFKSAQTLSNTVVEVDSNILNPSKNVQLWDVDKTEDFLADFHQSWLFLPVRSAGPHSYYLFNLGSKKMMSWMIDRDNDKRLQVADGEVSNKFLFEIKANDAHTVRIQGKSISGATQGLTYGDQKNGGLVSAGPGTTDASQLFTLDYSRIRALDNRAPDLSIMISPVHDEGRTLDVPNGSFARGTVIQTWDHSKTNDNQFFVLEESAPGSHNYRIKVRKNGLYLQPRGRSTQMGAPIVQERLGKNDPAQLWNFYFQPTDWTSLYIVNLYSGLALDVAGQGKQNGSTLQQWMLTGGDNQKFHQWLPY